MKTPMERDKCSVVRFKESERARAIEGDRERVCAKERIKDRERVRE